MRSASRLLVMVLTLFIAGTTPSAADDIAGCFKKNNGQLRIVNDHSECLPSDLPITLPGDASQEPPPPPQPPCASPPDLVGSWIGTANVVGNSIDPNDPDSGFAIQDQPMGLEILRQQGAYFQVAPPNPHPVPDVDESPPLNGFIRRCSEIRMTSNGTVIAAEYDADTDTMEGYWQMSNSPDSDEPIDEWSPHTGTFTMVRESP